MYDYRTLYNKKSTFFSTLQSFLSLFSIITTNNEDLYSVTDGVKLT